MFARRRLVHFPVYRWGHVDGVLVPYVDRWICGVAPAPGDSLTTERASLTCDECLELLVEAQDQLGRAVT